MQGDNALLGFYFLTNKSLVLPGSGRKPQFSSRNTRMRNCLLVKPPSKKSFGTKGLTYFWNFSSGTVIFFAFYVNIGHDRIGHHRNFAKKCIFDCIHTQLNMDETHSSTPRSGKKVAAPAEIPIFAVRRDPQKAIPMQTVVHMEDNEMLIFLNH